MVIMLMMGLLERAHLMVSMVASFLLFFLFPLFHCCQNSMVLLFLFVDLCQRMDFVMQEEWKRRVWRKRMKRRKRRTVGGDFEVDFVVDELLDGFVEVVEE